MRGIRGERCHERSEVLEERGVMRGEGIRGERCHERRQVS